DILKGTAAVVLLFSMWGRDHSIIAGLGAFLGHLFPLWLRFKGGKGVATYIGVLAGLGWLAASWWPLVAFGVAWAVVAALTRYSSLSALIACAMTPVALWAAGDTQEAQLFLLLTVLVFLKHRANITRLMAGTEPKIGKREAAAEAG